jgi:hypothetical protein
MWAINFAPNYRLWAVVFAPACRLWAITFAPVCRMWAVKFAPNYRMWAVKFTPVCRKDEKFYLSQRSRAAPSIFFYLKLYFLCQPLNKFRLKGVANNRFHGMKCILAADRYSTVKQIPGCSGIRRLIMVTTNSSKCNLSDSCMDKQKHIYESTSTVQHFHAILISHAVAGVNWHEIVSRISG